MSFNVRMMSFRTLNYLRKIGENSVETNLPTPEVSDDMSKYAQSLLAAAFAILFTLGGIFQSSVAGVEGHSLDASIYVALTFSFAFAFAILVWGLLPE
jgi:hypothetical protein